RLLSSTDGFERFLAFLALVVRHHAGHVVHAIRVVQVHQTHALRVAARHPDSLPRHPDHHPLLGDQHQLVVGQHFLDGHRITRLLGAVYGDDALTAALLHAVVVDRRALAHAAFGD